MFEELNPPYATIVVDPPWHYDEGWAPFGPTSRGGDLPRRRRLPYSYVELFARQPRLGWDSWGHGYEGVA